MASAESTMLLWAKRTEAEQRLKQTRERYTSSAFVAFISLLFGFGKGRRIAPWVPAGNPCLESFCCYRIECTQRTCPWECGQHTWQKTILPSPSLAFPARTGACCCLRAPSVPRAESQTVHTGFCLVLCFSLKQEADQP